MKKLSFVKLLGGGGIVLIILLSTTFDRMDVKTYDVDPPMINSVTVQNITNSEIAGNMILRVSYDTSQRMPTTLKVYYNNTNSILLHDDGVFPDTHSGDNIYSTIYTEDIDQFRSRIQAVEQELDTKKYLTRWEGHDGKLVTELNRFDFEAFDNGIETNVDLMAIAPADCNDDILKQNSLFITDLSVVEDNTRTFNTETAVGNSSGLYTFGNLMGNMANSSQTGVSKKDFLKHWVKNWINSGVAPNQHYKNYALQYLIAPWISKALNSANINSYSVISSDPNYWENAWDDVACQESELLKWAPFKLTAIVNRIDLRGNSAYKAEVSNSGETRFIFSLVSLYDDLNFGMVKGKVPKHNNQQLIAGNGFVDWEGMNVIFEYNNLQNDKCAVRDFGQQWLNLSDLTLGSQQYNDALAAITNMVIQQNAAPIRPNGSAIGRVRTNEKLFSSIGQTNTEWASANWEFRQFEIDPVTHLLERVELTNSPAFGVMAPGYNLGGTLGLDGQEAFTDWAYTPANYNRILLERHLIPKTYVWNMKLGAPQTVDFLSKFVQMNNEYLHYTDFAYGNSLPNELVNVDPYDPNLFYDPSLSPSGFKNENFKKLRHKLSLNTCQGCHGGETKTLFTQVMPMGYGESAVYWDENVAPDHLAGSKIIDTRSGVVIPNENDKLTLHDGNYVKNYPEPNNAAIATFQRVSAFITGRIYRNSSYQDDMTKGTDDDETILKLKDDKITGFFYVNDPSNDASPNGSSVTSLFQDDDRQWPFNELERRKEDLCKLVQSECLPTPNTIPIIWGLTFSPTLFQ